MLLRVLLVGFFLISCSKNTEKFPHIKELMDGSIETGKLNSCFLTEKCKEFLIEIKNDINETSNLDLSERKARMGLYSNFLHELYLNQKYNIPDKNYINSQLIDKYSWLRNQISHFDRNSESLYYHPLELEAVFQVEKDFGKLEMDINRDTISFESEKGAWSGYWYPYSRSNLLYERDSTLDRLDKVFRKEDLNYGAAEFEKNILGSINVDVWEGHCHAWAIASLIFPEPKQSIKVKGISFDISDLKLIRLKMAERVSFNQYGIRYRGNMETDGTFQDIRPEAFHQVVLKAIQGKKNIIMDDDPGVEVWSKPIVGFKSKIVKFNNNGSYVDIETWLKIVRQRSDLSNELTSGRDYSIIKYDYRIYIKKLNSGDYKAIRGEWLHQSKLSHPDSLLVIKNDKPFSANPVLQSNTEYLKNHFLFNN